MVLTRDAADCVQMKYYKKMTNITNIFK